MYSRIKTYLSLIIFFSLISLTSIHPVYAQQVSPSPQKATFMKATITGSEGIKKNPYSDYQSTIQLLDATILDGPYAGKVVQLQYDDQNIKDLQLNVGDTVVLSQTTSTQGQATYTVDSKYRLSALTLLAIVFFALILLIVGWRAIGSFIGLGISLVVIFAYIVPQILAGVDPMSVCLIGSVIILLLTTYTAHGVSKQSTIALVSTLITLLVTFGISVFAVQVSLLTGYVDENSIAIHFGTGHLIDVKGLFLGGIIIGTLGALNDITTTQAVTMFELSKTDATLNKLQLFKKGLVLGREHVISMINTLVLAYAGASLTVFLFLFYNSSYYPLWVILNSETLNEEIIRTIAGTSGLVLVVPIVTFISAYFATKTPKSV